MIPNRLLVVPRPIRVSALRAELTILNHKLPVEVCLISSGGKALQMHRGRRMVLPKPTIESIGCPQARVLC